jgi:hypothetical protein
MNAEKDEDTTEATIYSHRTGITELQEGDKVVFGEDADHGAGRYTITNIELAEHQSDIRVIVKDWESESGLDEYKWSLSDIEGATESNDAHIERDGETVA